MIEQDWLKDIRSVGLRTTKDPAVINHASYTGVLVAFHDGVWKVELKAQDKGGMPPYQTFLLPRFQASDVPWSSIWNPWRLETLKNRSARRAMIRLSAGIGKLLALKEGEPVGWNVEFVIVKSKVFVLAVRAITQKEESEMVLTVGNHQEILPPRVSPFMLGIIIEAGPDLFGFYKELDPSLPDQPFLVEADGLPWINFSALMDMLVHWGLPTRMAAESVGAIDYYHLGIRPWRVLRNLKVLIRLHKKQRQIILKMKNWVNKQRHKLRIHRLERVLMWQTDAPLAAEVLIEDFRAFYIQLVTQMQLLSSAMSGPISLFNGLGVLSKVAKRLVKTSASTDYFHAFEELSEGRMSRKRFLRNYGHRGFYESDIGQPRFQEYSEQEWLSLLHNNANHQLPAATTKNRSGSIPIFLQGLVSLIHSREWLRHVSMQFFWYFREEMMAQTEKKMGPGFNPWKYRPEDLLILLRGQKWIGEIEPYPEPGGWDLDTFFYNGYGRCQPLDQEPNLEERGIGIYPGKVCGQVWRVSAAEMSQITVPAYEKVILVADALDPGWIPYFTKVDGVISYSGGLLSQASIILREAGIPSITQYPSDEELPNGTWIEMDGKTGAVKILHEIVGI